MFGFIRDHLTSKKRSLQGYVLRGDPDQAFIMNYIAQFGADKVMSRSLALPSGRVCQMSLIDDTSSIYTHEKNRALVYAVRLPFTLNLHLFAVSPGARTHLDTTLVEPIILEGDYQDFFQLYAIKGQQVEARYTLDPKAMLTTIEYMHEYVWEILGNTLYIVCERDFMSTDVIEMFIKEITPAIAPTYQSDVTETHDRYIEADPNDIAKIPTFFCPKCTYPMNVSEYAYACPWGDGFFLSDLQLKNSPNAPGFAWDMVALSERAETILASNKSIASAVTYALQNSRSQHNIGCALCGTPMTSSQKNNPVNGVSYECDGCQYNFIDTSTIRDNNLTNTLQG